MKLLPIGRLARPRGLGGEIFVVAYHAASPAWAPGSVLHLMGPAREMLTVSRVERGAKGRLAVRFREVSTLEQAQALHGQELAMEAASLAPPGQGEFYHHEVIGWAVVTLEGEPVGEVVGVLPLEQDLFEVRPPGGGATFYVPVIRDVVKAIDRERRRVVIEVLDGLLP